MLGLAAGFFLFVPASGFSGDEPGFRWHDRIRQRIEERQHERATLQAEDLPHEEKKMAFDGRERTYLVHVPPMYDGTTTVPLVVVFHGGGGNAVNALRMSEMSARADEQGFISVYPNGTGRTRFLTWNVHNCCGYALTHHVDDIGFVRAMVAQLKKDYVVDPQRIYATGLSNGGMMSYKVGLELSDIFAAVAPVAGAMNTDEPHAEYPVSFIIFHGTDDRHVRYEGGKPYQQADRIMRVDKPVRYAVDFWVTRDHCPAPPAMEQSGSIEVERYSGCEAGTSVELYTIHGQGHAWPGGRNGIRYGNVDPPTDELRATDVMWEFFKNHPKK